MSSPQGEVKGHYWTKNDKIIEATKKDSKALHMEYRYETKLFHLTGGVSCASEIDQLLFEASLLLQQCLCLLFKTGTPDTGSKGH